MSYNINCITCQLVSKGEVKIGKNRNGEEYKTQALQLKVPRLDPTTNPSTGYDYIKMTANTDVVDFIEKHIPLFTWINVDFVLRSFKTKENKEFETRNAILVTPSKIQP